MYFLSTLLSSDNDLAALLKDRLINTGQCPANAHFNVKDMKDIFTILLYHLERVKDALDMYAVAAPAGLISHQTLGEAIRLASGMRVEPYVTETLFALFYDSRTKQFDLEEFCQVLYERKNFGLPLQMKNE